MSSRPLMLVGAMAVVALLVVGSFFAVRHGEKIKAGLRSFSEAVSRSLGIGLSSKPVPLAAANAPAADTGAAHISAETVTDSPIRNSMGVPPSGEEGGGNKNGEESVSTAEADLPEPPNDETAASGAEGQAAKNSAATPGQPAVGDGVGEAKPRKKKPDARLRTERELTAAIFHSPGWLSYVDSSNILDYISLAESLPPGLWKQNILTQLIMRWINWDGKAAVEYLLGQGNNIFINAVLPSALGKWSSRAPRPALEWFKEKLAESSGTYLIHVGVVFGSMYSAGRQWVVDEALALQPEQASDAALWTIESILIYQFRNDKAFEIAELLPDGPRKNSLYCQIVSVLGQAGPDESVFELLKKISSAEARAAAYGALARAWMDVNLAKAVEWVGSLEDKELKSRCVKEVFAVWLSRSRENAIAWLVKAASVYPPDASFDLALALGASKVAKADPATAIALLLKLSDNEAALSEALKAFTAWAAKDKSEAAQYLAADTRLPPPVREAFEKALEELL